MAKTLLEKINGKRQELIRLEERIKADSVRVRQLREEVKSLESRAIWEQMNLAGLSADNVLHMLEAARRDRDSPGIIADADSS